MRLNDCPFPQTGPSEAQYLLFTEEWRLSKRKKLICICSRKLITRNVLTSARFSILFIRAEFSIFAFYVYYHQQCKGALCVREFRFRPHNHDRTWYALAPATATGGHSSAGSPHCKSEGFFLPLSLSLFLSTARFFFVYEMWERNTKQAVRYIPEFTFSFWPCLALPLFDCRSLPLAGWLVGWLVGCSAQQISDFRLDSVPFSSPFPQKPPRGWGIPVCRNGTHSLAGTTECNYIDDSGWILEWNFAHCRYRILFFL